MIVEHVAGFVGLLDLPGNIMVYDDTVPDDPDVPYVVVYSNQGMPENASMADVSDWQHFSFQTTVVAQTQGQARLLADRVQSALLDKRPTVVGRSVGRLSKTSSQPVRRDDDVSPPVFYAVDVWALTTVPA